MVHEGVFLEGFGERDKVYLIPDRMCVSRVEKIHVAARSGGMKPCGLNDALALGILAVVDIRLFSTFPQHGQRYDAPWSGDH